MDPAENRTEEPTRDEIRAALRSAYKDLVEFASTDAFQKLLAELYSLPETARPSFVNEVVLNPTLLRERGVVPPAGILIQRSSFGDRRPTLFCLKKYVPERLRTLWQNANLTFDNLVTDDSVPRDQ
ncbi:MAG: hypothetical protein JO332_16670, partial [Planctomycetaceae bacterium]|nr:hypothetical protein [Planctomycetaceae bacterium]